MLKNPGSDVAEARDKALHKLMQLEARTPLTGINADDRAQSEKRRAFFRKTFLHG